MVCINLNIFLKIGTLKIIFFHIKNVLRKKNLSFEIKVPLRYRTHRPNTKAPNRVRLQANFFALRRQNTDWIICRYHVTFEPIVECPRFRRALVNQHNAVIGTYLFDGTQLFVLRRLKQESFTSKDREGTSYELKFKFTGDIEPTSKEFIQILNLIQRSATSALKFQLVGRNFYDANEKAIVMFILFFTVCTIFFLLVLFVWYIPILAWFSDRLDQFATI